MSLIPSTIGNTETSSTLLSPNSSNVYDEILLQQSTPVKNQLDSHKAFSKSKKLGQILKLASVRGAKVNKCLIQFLLIILNLLFKKFHFLIKSKSMKHKYLSQLQQHSFVSINSDTSCHICQKSLLNKKALHCKSKYIHA